MLEGCIPWHGMFGPDMLTPVYDDGTPVIAGKRICGNLDCVSTLHVI
jgi:hypothetical protein